MLIRKMYRDLWENKGAYIACIVIILIGLMIFTSYSKVMDNLIMAQQDFYKAQNFADGFIEVEGMPYDEAIKLGNIKGIDLLQGRLVKDVRVLFPGRNENVYLRIVSMDTSQDKILNDVMLIQGSPLDPKTMNIWIDNKFFEANKMELNQEIQIIAGGKKKDLQIVGMGRSPEFIYAMRTSSDLFPTPSTFGIAYMPLETMKNIFSEGGNINNIVFTLEPGVLYEDVEEVIKPELNKYGLKGIVSRKNQLSHLLLTEELKGIQSVSKSLPTLFLGIAAMILYITLKRMIERQRGQIGILKAFGYTHREIMMHYLSYAVFIGSVGGILGSAAGTALSYPFTTMYEMFFNMPGLEGTISYSYFVTGTFLSLAFSVLAGYRGAKGALALEPAEAMRPAAPMTGREVLLEKAAFIWNMLTVQGRMAVRNIFRHPGRTLFMFLGIMFTFSLLSLPWTFKQLSDEMLIDQYEQVQTYNIKIPFASPLKQKEAERELSRYPGVNIIETMTEVPITLKNQWLQKDVLLLGLVQNSQLYHILDKDGKEAPLPQNGILLSERLAELLDAEPGTTITLESKMMKDPERKEAITVTGVIPQIMGINAYMDIKAAQELFGQGAIATSIILDIDEGHVSSLRTKYQNVETINGIEDSTQMLEQSKEMMASFNAAIVIMVLFGMITGFAIIYNASLVTLSERSRDLATMLVLGMTSREVLSVITFEQWFLGVFGMLAGIPLTKMLLVIMAQSFNNDIYTMPSTTSGISFIIALIFTVLSIWFAQQIAARKISSFDLVEVLKDRE